MLLVSLLVVLLIKNQVLKMTLILKVVFRLLVVVLPLLDDGSRGGNSLDGGTSAYPSDLVVDDLVTTSSIVGNVDDVAVATTSDIPIDLDVDATNQHDKLDVDGVPAVVSLHERTHAESSGIVSVRVCTIIGSAVVNPMLVLMCNVGSSVANAATPTLVLMCTVVRSADVANPMLVPVCTVTVAARVADLKLVLLCTATVVNVKLVLLCTATTTDLVLVPLCTVGGVDSDVDLSNAGVDSDVDDVAKANANAGVDSDVNGVVKANVDVICC